MYKISISINNLSIGIYILFFICVITFHVGAQRWDSEIDSILYSCNSFEVNEFYNKYKTSTEVDSKEMRNVRYAKLLRLCMRISDTEAIDNYISALKPENVYTLEGRKELVKACTDFVQYSELSGKTVDLNKIIPAFDQININQIYNTPEYSCLLGYLYRYIRKYNDSIDLFNNALEISENNTCHPSTHLIRYESLIGMAQSFIDTGKYEEAFQTLERFDKEASTFIPNRLHTARRLCTEGILHNYLGDYSKSLNLLSLATNSLMETKDVTSITALELMRAIGKTFMAMGQYEQALKSFDSLDNILNKHFEGVSSMWLEILNLRMNSRIALGRYDEAVTLEKISGLEKLNFKENPLKIFNYFKVNNSLAECWIKLGFPSQASMMLEISANAYNDMDTYVATECRDIYNSLGYAQLKSDKTQKAAQSFKKQLDIDRKFAHDVFLFLPETQRTAYWVQTEPKMNRLFSLNQSGSVTLPDGSVTTIKTKDDLSEIGGLLYDASLLNKGLMLQTSINLKNLVADSGNNDIETILKRLSEIRCRRAAGAEISESENLESEKLERQLIKESRKYGDYMQFSETRWQDIRNRLGENEVAVEFVMSRDGEIQYYSAEVISNDMSQPEHIFLFGLKDGDKRFDRDNIYNSSQLYNKVWKKILEKCRPGDTIYFSPAGKLYNLAIEHAAIPEGGRINTVYNPVRLSSTRELMNSGTNKMKSDAVLFGGLNYDMSVFDMELLAMENQIKRGSMRGCSQLRVEERGAWQYLPGTLEEVSAISTELKNKNIGSIRVFSGSEGIEEIFKSLSGGENAIIHIATHGFYIPAPDNGNDEVRLAYVNSDESLLRSALILSGGNNGWLFPEGIPEGVDDGVLTAKEISEMDLSQTELVVMSACQTGLGDISNEGVFGLQRAFKSAGVRSLVMSLAPVHDDATRMLMTEFYIGLNTGLSKREAFRKAQDAVRAADFEINGEMISGQDARFWAPFVIMD